MISGVFLQTVTLLILTSRTNWNAEVKKSFLSFMYLIQTKPTYFYHNAKGFQVVKAASRVKNSSTIGNQDVLQIT